MGETRLLVRDNGVGLPEGFDYRKCNSLGLQLINMLPRQLKRDIEVCNELGPEFAITFSPDSGHVKEPL